MAKQKIIGFEIRPLQEKSGYRNRKVREDEILCMKLPGGSVFLRKSTLEEAGDSWDRLRRRLARLAEENGIPFTDDTAED